MLLNEIKKVFETDRAALQGTLNDLNLNFDPDFSNMKRGDVDPSLRPILDRSIITTDYTGPTKDEVNELTSTPETRKKTIDSLENLMGNLAHVEDDFSTKLKSMDTEAMKLVASAEKGDIGAFVTKARAVIKEPPSSSRILKDHYEETKTKFNQERTRLSNVLLKQANAEKFGDDTIAALKNFLKSDQWLNHKDSTDPKMSGVSEFRKRAERFYAALGFLQQNAANVAKVMAATKG